MRSSTEDFTRRRPNETIYANLMRQFDLIYQGNEMPASHCVKLHSLIVKYCHDKDIQNETDRRCKTMEGPEFIGGLFQDYLIHYTITARQQLQNMDGFKLLDYYTRFWKTFKEGSRVSHQVLDYINKNWIHRGMNIRLSEVFMIYNLAIKHWKDEIFEKLHRKVTSAALELIEQDRNGKMIESSLVKIVVESYVELGINELRDDTQEPEAENSAAAIPVDSTPDQQIQSSTDQQIVNYTIYKKYFLERFLKETHDYYNREANKFIQTHSVAEYMEKVEERLSQERDRCFYLNQATTFDPLMKVCNDVLIAQHVHLLHGEFKSFLNNGLISDIGRTYNLCQRVGALDPLKKDLEAHIVREGRAAIQRIAHSALSDPKHFVDAVLQQHNIFYGWMEVAFKRDSEFFEAMDAAFVEFVNTNEITRLSKRPSKPTEMLVQYSDQLLRNGIREVSNKNTDELFEQVIIVLKYIGEAELFRALFQRRLCNRLVTGQSVNLADEQLMLSKLKDLKGIDYTDKLERLYKDVVQLSRELNKEFKTQKRSAGNGIDFSVIVVAKASWALQESNSFEVPKQLQDCMKAFHTFFTNKNKRRKLNWQLQISRGELTCTFAKQQYIFTCTTEQISVLMLFNGGSKNNARSYTRAEISKQMNFPEEELVPTLQSLISVGLLTLTKEGGAYQLNRGFTSKEPKVNLVSAMGAAARQQQKKETVELQKSVEETHTDGIKAVIVHILKTRKRLKHQELVKEVQDRLKLKLKKPSYTIKRAIMRRCITELIGQEYIQRAVDDNDTYEYVESDE